MRDTTRIGNCRSRNYTILTRGYVYRRTVFPIMLYDTPDAIETVMRTLSGSPPLRLELPGPNVRPR